MVSPVSAGGGFTRTGICTIVDMRSLEIEVDVNESYINRVKPGAGRHGGARCLSRLADSRARSSRPCRPPIARRPPCSCASAFKKLDPRILPDMGVKVTFLREADARPGSALAGHRAARPGRRAGAKERDSTGKRPDLRLRRASETTVERRAVTTGGTDGDRLEVLAGLERGRSRRRLAAARRWRRKRRQRRYVIVRSTVTVDRP